MVFWIRRFASILGITAFFILLLTGMASGMASGEEFS